MIKVSVLTSLYRCDEYLIRFFDSVLKIKNLNEIEFVFIHNDPLDIEKDIIKEVLTNNTNINYQYLEVPREGLYTSWNRGISVANGEFLAMWNVDDLWMPDSFRIFAKSLEENENVGMVYGNIYTAKSVIDTNLIFISPTDISQSSWNHSFQGGSFLMWRKSVHNSVGYFDEQFKISGDSDFWYRLAERFKIIKVNATIGIYLKEINKGLSRTLNIGCYEAIIIGLRYGFYPRLVPNPFGWKKAFKMINPKIIISFGQKNKRKILKYHSPMIYIMSFFSLLFLSIPLYLLSKVLDLTQYNFHYFKKLIINK